LQKFDYYRFFAKDGLHVPDAGGTKYSNFDNSGGKNYRDLDVNIEDDKTFLTLNQEPNFSAENPVFCELINLSFTACCITLLFCRC